MYNLDNQKYFSQIRAELLELIPQRSRSGNMLEIGAGGGDTLVYAKKNGFANKVYGVDLFKIEGSNQTNPIIDEFKIQNIEECNLDCNENYFDVIIMADILEHLINPYEVLTCIKKYLTKDGVIIASIPNFRHYDVLKSVFLDGDFKYSDLGILDKTHLRFFCKKNIVDLFENSKLHISQITSIFEIKKKGRKYIFNKLFFSKLEEFLVVQYFVVAHKL